MWFFFYTDSIHTYVYRYFLPKKCWEIYHSAKQKTMNTHRPVPSYPQDSCGTGTKYYLSVSEIQVFGNHWNLNLRVILMSIEPIFLPQKSNNFCAESISCRYHTHAIVRCQYTLNIIRYNLEKPHFTYVLQLVTYILSYKSNIIFKIFLTMNFSQHLRSLLVLIINSQWVFI